MAFYANMLDHKRFLRKAGVQSVTPDPDDKILEPVREKDFQEVKRRASMRHIRRVRDQKTFGILVMNVDKHGIHDYIGPNTFAEIAIALSHYKRIYLYQGIPEFYRDELVSWQVIPLNGDISKLIADYQEALWRDTIQLTLFDF